MRFTWATVTVILLTLALAGYAQTKASAEDVGATCQLLSKEIQLWGKDAVIVKAVKEQNAKRISLVEIQAIDKAWIANSAEERKKELLNNDVAQRLRLLKTRNTAFTESFVMDGQGANVAMTSKTSDYWQGDEAKWKKAFNDGRGAVFVDKPQYDTSAKAILVQISVPVMDGNRAIGVITVGVNLDVIKNSANRR